MSQVKREELKAKIKKKVQERDDDGPVVSGNAGLSAEDIVYLGLAASIIPIIGFVIRHFEPSVSLSFSVVGFIITSLVLGEAVFWFSKLDTKGFGSIMEATVVYKIGFIILGGIITAFAYGTANFVYVTFPEMVAQFRMITMEQWAVFFKSVGIILLGVVLLVLFFFVNSFKFRWNRW